VAIVLLGVLLVEVPTQVQGDYLSGFGVILANATVENSTDASIEACVAGATNHGQCVSCVVQLSQGLWKSGVITLSENQAIKVGIAHSSLCSGSTIASNTTNTTGCPPLSHWIEDQCGMTLSPKAASSFDQCSTEISNKRMKSCAQKAVKHQKKSIGKRASKKVKKAIQSYSCVPPPPTYYNSTSSSSADGGDGGDGGDSGSSGGGEDGGSYRGGGGDGGSSSGGSDGGSYGGRNGGGGGGGGDN